MRYPEPPFMMPTPSIAIALIVAEIAATAFGQRDAEHRIAGTANVGYSGSGYGYGGSQSFSAGVIKEHNGAVLHVALDGTSKGVETSIGEMRRKLVAKDILNI
jgi:hypothetical protein